MTELDWAFLVDQACLFRDTCLEQDSGTYFKIQVTKWNHASLQGKFLTMQVATLLLTKCAAAGLTLAEIGSIASRPLVGMEEEPSQLERICRLARSAVDAEMADADSSSGESEYGSMRGHFIGGGKEASFTHLLEQGEQNTGVVMGRRVLLSPLHDWPGQGICRSINCASDSNRMVVCRK